MSYYFFESSINLQKFVIFAEDGNVDDGEYYPDIPCYNSRHYREWKAIHSYSKNGIMVLQACVCNHQKFII